MKNIFLRYIALWIILSMALIFIWAIFGPSLIGKENTTLFAIILVILCLSLVTILVLMPVMATGGFGKKRILKTGLKATAKVVKIGELGGSVVTIQDQPVLSLELEVNDGIRAPYIVSIDSIIPRAAVPQFQPGAIIPVRIDRNNSQNVVIDWNEM